MKKLTFALATLVSLPTFAQNWYVQGDIGISNFEDVDSPVPIEDNVTTFKLSAGYKFDNFRTALDFTKLGKATTNDFSVSMRSIGLSAIYDFKTNSEFTPYLGIRLSSNKYKFSIPSRYSYVKVENDSSSGIGALGGIQYRLNQQLSLNANIEYNRTALDYAEYGAKVGLRFDF